MHGKKHGSHPNQKDNHPNCVRLGRASVLTIFDYVHGANISSASESTAKIFTSPIRHQHFVSYVLRVSAASQCVFHKSRIVINECTYNKIVYMPIKSWWLCYSNHCSLESRNGQINWLLPVHRTTVFFRYSIDINCNLGFLPNINSKPNQTENALLFSIYFYLNLCNSVRWTYLFHFDAINKVLLQI